MGVTLFIRAYDETTYTTGTVSYSGQNLESILAQFPGFSDLQITSIDECIGVFSRNVDDQQSAKALALTSFNNSGGRVSIRFEVKSLLEINSGSIRNSLRSYLNRTDAVPAGSQLPFCCLVDTADVQSIMSGNGESELSLMQSQNDWMGIYRMFQPIAELRQNQLGVWNDVSKLNTIGYACGKLAEVSVNLNRDFPNQQQKATFLQQQSKYRAETEMLRKRCVEIQPNNAGYWSSLAYLYYQNCIELTQPGGRRDGDFGREANKAVEYIDKALELDDTRVSDLYRKGYLLADKFSNQILFGSDRSSQQQRSERSKLCVTDGLQALGSAIETWEKFTPADRNYSRYQKDYIKALYQAGGAYFSLIINDWDEAFFLLNLEQLIDETDRISINRSDLNNADKSWENFYKCWHSERSDLNSEIPSEISTRPSGAVDGIHKLYSLGKVRFAKFLILSGGGQKRNNSADIELDEAERLLYSALQCAWPLENQRQKKDHIAELLARIYIVRKDYDKASSIIQQYASRRLDSYVADTLATALTLSGRFDEAQQLFNNAVNDRGNKKLWKTLLSQGCALSRAGKQEEATKLIDEADKEARRQGRQTVDTILIARAFICYKSDDLQAAVDYLIQAITLNSYRVSVQNRLRRWQEKLRLQKEDNEEDSEENQH